MSDHNEKAAEDIFPPQLRTTLCPRCGTSVIGDNLHTCTPKTTLLTRLRQAAQANRNAQWRTLGDLLDEAANKIENLENYFAAQYGGAPR